MTQYMISVHHVQGEEDFPTDPAVLQQLFDDVDAFNKRVMDAGAWVFGGGLTAITDATTVDNTAGDNVVTDGPFAESKEYLGGFWVIEAPDLDAALKWAAEGSQACQGRVEVRPFQAE